MTVRAVVGRVAGALALAGAAVVGMASPAAAATTVTVTSPRDNAVITDTSSPQLSGHVDSDAFVCSIDLVVRPTAGQSAMPQKITISLQPNGGSTASRSADFQWAPVLPMNGGWRLTVIAHTLPDPFCQVGTPGDTSFDRSFALAVAPAAPTGLKSTVAGAPDRHVDLAWNPNPETDITGYGVFRVAKGSTCAAPTPSDRIATVDAASKPAYSDVFGSADPGGTYCYTIEAVRPGATTDTVVLSSPSTADEAAVAAPAGLAGGAAGEGGSGTGAGDGAGGQAGGASAGGAAPSVAGGLDLSRFGALEQQAAKGAANASRSTKLPPLPDGTFDPKLPFKPGSAPTEDGEQALPGETVTSVHGGDNADRVRGLAAVAAGLVALVVAGHLVLLRREVKRTPVLDAVEP